MAVEACDRRTWEQLASEADPGFYGNPDWLEAVCEASGGTPRYLVVTTKDVPTIRIACVEKRRWGQKLLTTPALAPYCGFAEHYPADLAPDRTEQRRGDALVEFAEWCERNSAYARLVLPPEVSDVRPFLWRGWRAELRYTYRIDLTAPGAPLLRTNARRNFDSAVEAGLSAIRPSENEAVAMLSEALSDTFRRQGEPLPMRERPWGDYLRRVVALPSVQVVAITDGTNVHAAVATAFDSRRAYELLAGTTEQGNASGASVLALVTAMRDAAARVPEFDFAGANIPTIARFKRGFGGKLVPYAAVSWAQSAIWRWAAECAPAWEWRVRRSISA